MNYDQAMKTAHALDCPAHPSCDEHTHGLIHHTAGAICNCGLDILRDQLYRQKEGYEAWLKERRKT